MTELLSLPFLPPSLFCSYDLGGVLLSTKKDHSGEQQLLPLLNSKRSLHVQEPNW